MVAPNHAGLRFSSTAATRLSVKARERGALGLLILLIFSIMTLWVAGRWPLSLFQGGVFALALSIAARPLLGRFAFRGNILLLPLAGVLCLGALQIATRQTAYSWATRDAILAWTANLALVFLALQLFRDQRTRRRFLRSIFYFGFAVSVLATTQMITSPTKILWLFPSGYSDYVMGPFVSRNLYAAFIELLLPIGLVQALAVRRQGLTNAATHAAIHAAMCGVMFASVVASASRAGFIVVSGEVLAALLLARMRRLVSTRTLVLALGQFAILSVAFIGLFGGAALWQRLQESDPYGGRREMLRSTLDMAQARPWMGFGLGTWRTTYPQFAYYDDGTIPSHAHNDWAEWWAEGGFPLFLMMLTTAVLCVRPAVGSLWGIGILALLLHCLVDSPLQNPVFAGWFFLLAGVLAAGAGHSGANHSGADHAGADYAIDA